MKLFLIFLILPIQSFSMTHQERINLLIRKRMNEAARQRIMKQREESKQGISRVGRVSKKDEKIQVYFRYCEYVKIPKKIIDDFQIKENKTYTFYVSFSDRCQIVGVKK